MWSALRGGASVACYRLAFIPMQRKKLDENRIENPLVRDPDSGVDRVLQIFDRDEFGTISPEAAFINMYTFTGGILGAIYGGLLHSRLSNLRFRESNEVTAFYSNKAAQQKLLDTMTLSFGKGAFRYGVRYAIFCASFSGLSTIISRFRGESGMVEYSIAGLLTGAFYKFGMGPKGMIAGGFFGCLLGTFGGSMIYILTKTFGVTMDDLYNTSKLYFTYKDKSFQNSHKVQVEEPDILLQTKYPGGMGSMKHTLDDLEDIRSISELKFNKNPTLKLKSELSKNVNNLETK